MVTPIESAKAPAVSLTSLDGTAYSLYQRLKESQVVLLAFLKVSCPVCHLAFPYLERLHRSYPSLPMWGISQDDADATRSFAKMFGVTFPILLDELLETTASFGLTTVPSMFLIGQEGKIIQSSIGFVKAELENLNLELATASNNSAKPLFTQADEVPALKPGCASKQPV